MKCAAHWTVALTLFAMVKVARAESSVTISPRTVKPGDPVLVTVTGSPETPRGKADRKPLHFFAVRDGHQAVFAVPLDREPGELKIDIRGGAPPEIISVVEHEFPTTEVTVAEEYADPNPPPPIRKRIEDDNRAIRKSFGKPGDAPQFRREFRPPVSGRSTSPFGELRTFNGVQKSQHLGEDLAARDGAPIKAINEGTVVLVRDCFLPGLVVVVAHGAGIASAYFHLKEAAVAEGDVIARGAVIGRTGQTGRTTGPHVHLSVWVPGGFVDPAAFLRLGIRPALAEPSPDEEPAANKRVDKKVDKEVDVEDEPPARARPSKRKPKSSRR